MQSIREEKIASGIAVGPNDSSGKPAWIRTEDGTILMSQRAINDATVLSARVYALVSILSVRVKQQSHL